MAILHSAARHGAKIRFSTATAVGRAAETTLSCQQPPIYGLYCFDATGAHSDEVRRQRTSDVLL